jgi:hypothetical protein
MRGTAWKDKGTSVDDGEEDVSVGAIVIGGTVVRVGVSTLVVTADVATVADVLHGQVQDCLG